MAEPLSEGAGGQFLGERRSLTIREQAEAVESFIARSPRLSEDEKNIVRATWTAATAFARIAQYDGFDEALASLTHAREPELMSTS